MDILQKPCSICKVLKPLDCFHNLKTGKFKKHSNCKECRAKYRKNLSYSKPINGKIKCTKCHIIKTVDDFYKDRSASTGLQSCCKLCMKENIYESQSKLEGYISKIYNNLVNQLNKNNIKNNITKQDILDIYYKQDKKCKLSSELLTYYSGPNLTIDRYESKYNITIDKIDNNKPYSKDNIQLLGSDIHKMKGNLSNQEFIRLCNLISNKNK